MAAKGELFPHCPEVKVLDESTCRREWASQGDHARKRPSTSRDKNGRHSSVLDGADLAAETSLPLPLVFTTVFKVSKQGLLACSVRRRWRTHKAAFAADEGKLSMLTKLALVNERG